MTLRSVRSGCGHVLSWLVILGIAAVVAISVLVPRVAGATPYAVLTGSMRPSMPVGTMVVVRPLGAERIRIGDVITYQLASGRPEVVTHRVVALGVDGAGRRIFRTQGDANEVADPGWVRAVQVKGVRWYDVPYLGRYTNLLDGTTRQVALVLSAGSLLLYAALMIGSDVRDRRRRGVPTSPPAPAVTVQTHVEVARG
jgi:signal peptidase I